jgi:exopolysaccharide biosynthesis polyprenyl glycosylphosphotransferase
MAITGENLPNVSYTDAVLEVSRDTTLADTRSIRVLLVITGLATGGATNVVLDIARYLKDHPGYEVELITGPIPPGRNDVTHLAYELGVKTRVVPSMVNRISPAANLKAVIELQKIMVEGQYDIVHTHSSVAGVVGRLAALAAGIPVIIHHVHGWALHDGMKPVTKAIYVALERLCARFTDRIITVASPDIRKGLNEGIGKKEKFTLIHNGIDLDKFRKPVNEQKLRAELGLAPYSKLVGMIGRLDQQKNPLDLIRVAAIVVKSCPDVQFLILGDGSLRPECEKLIDELGLQERFILLGFRNDVPKILPILNLTAMSSLWEGLPLAFMEAMSAGKPVVANDVDGVSDIVVNGETGFLVPAHEPEAMAERIVRLLQDDELYQNMSRMAQERSEQYSLLRMMEQLDSLYQEQYREAANSLSSTRRLLGWAAGRAGEAALPATATAPKGAWQRIFERNSRFQAPFSERRMLLGLGDGLSILAAHMITIWFWAFSAQWVPNIPVDVAGVWNHFLPVTAIWIALGWLNDLYHVPSSYVKSRAVRRVIQTSVLALAVYAAIFSVFPSMPLYYYMGLTLAIIPSTGAWRIFYTVVFKRNAFRQRVLIIGSAARARTTVRDIEQRRFSSYQTFQVVGYVHEASPKRRPRAGWPEVRYLGQSRELAGLVDRHNVHEVVVSTDAKLRKQVFEYLVECQSKGVRVSWLPDFYERLYQSVPVEHINSNWALHMMQNRPVLNRLELGLKRLVDLALLMVALPIFLLLLIPIAIAIKLDSAGPVFYRQIRLGRAGEPFSIFKFRTMFTDAEKDGKARWASKDDPRITRVGSLLRKTRLDEIPQLINVLQGEMSIVGPRPERPEFVQELEKAIPFYRMRLLVKPGITGWAQINYDYGRSVDDALYKLEYDFYYVRYWSIWLDLYTLFRTVAVVFMMKG